MSSACANSSKMPDLSLVEAAAAAASPTRSEAEEDEELNAVAAEAVRNLKSDDEEDEVEGENGRRCEDDDDVDRKGLKGEIDDGGENKEKQVSHSVSLQNFFCKELFPRCRPEHVRICQSKIIEQIKVCFFNSFYPYITESSNVR